MTTRAYTYALVGTITVDDATLKSELISFTLEPAPGEPKPDPAEVFEVQQQMLASTDRESPARRMQGYLVNRYLVRVAPTITDLLRRHLPGAEAAVTGIQVTVDGETVGP